MKLYTPMPLLPRIAFVALAAPRLAGASTLAPNFRAGAHVHAANVRQALLANYDAMVPPASNRAATGTAYSATGTDVQLQVRFFKVLAVKASDGIMQIKVWVRLKWIDERLKWDPSAYGGVTSVKFRGQAADSIAEGEIWEPDIQRTRASARAPTHPWGTLDS